MLSIEPRLRCGAREEIAKIFQGSGGPNCNTRVRTPLNSMGIYSRAIFLANIALSFARAVWDGFKENIKSTSLRRPTAS